MKKISWNNSNLKKIYELFIKDAIANGVDPIYLIDKDITNDLSVKNLGNQRKVLLTTYYRGMLAGIIHADNMIEDSTYPKLDALHIIVDIMNDYSDVKYFPMDNRWSKDVSLKEFIDHLDKSRIA